MNHRARSKSAINVSSQNKRRRSKSAVILPQTHKLPSYSSTYKLRHHRTHHGTRQRSRSGFAHRNRLQSSRKRSSSLAQRISVKKDDYPIYPDGHPLQKRPFRYRSLSSFCIPEKTIRPLTSIEWRRQPQHHEHTRLIYDNRTDSSLRKGFKTMSLKRSIPWYVHRRYAVTTRYDALPFLDRVPEYKVTGPLHTIFDYYAALDNPHDELRWAALTFEEMKYGSTTMSTHELLYFCHEFKMLSKQLLKRNEVQIICQNTSGYVEKLRRAGMRMMETDKPSHTSDKTTYCQSCQLNLEEFCIVLARFAIILYPRLNVGGQWSAIEHKENVTAVDKWNAFVAVFGLNDSKYIRERIKNSRFVSNARLRSTSFVYNVRKCPKILRGTGTDLLRMGLAAKIGRKLGRTTNSEQLPFNPLPAELVDKVRELLYESPRRDWRKYQGPFINFGLVVRRQSRYDAVIEITNADRQMEPKWLMASLDDDAPNFVSLRGRMKVFLYYGIQWKLLVHLNMKETMDVDLDIGFVFNVLIHEGQKRGKPVAKIPVYVKLVEEINRTQRPCLKTVDFKEQIRFCPQRGIII